MTNAFYNATGNPGQAAPGYSATMRAEFQAIAAGFDKMPATLTPDRLVIINPGGTALTIGAYDFTQNGAVTFGGTFSTGSTFSTTGTFSSGGNFSTGGTFSTGGNFSASSTVAITGALSTAAALTFSGAFAVTWTATAAVTLTLPGTTTTLIGRDTTDTLTNKTFDTAGTGNSFKVNGTAITDKTGTGKVVLDTSPTISGLTLTGVLTGIGTNSATTYLGVDASIATAGTFVNGPNTGSIGVSGWVVTITATATVLNSSGGNNTFTADLWNGTTALDNSSLSLPSGFWGTISLSATTTLSAATTFTLRISDNVGGNVGAMKTSANNGTVNKASQITVTRIA